MTLTRHHDTTPDTLDAEEVFRFLGYNPNDPAARAAVGLCLRYQLDPFAGHIIVIAGRRSPYVTRDGHLYLAHASGQLDGIEVLEEWTTDKNCHAKVAVWRKDMSKPFVYTGRAPLKRGSNWDEHADKKAVANAEVRALKRAFPLQLPSIADYEDDIEPSGAGSRPALSVAGSATEATSPAPAPKRPPVPNQQEVTPTEADRWRDGGPNQARPGDGSPAVAAEVPESARPPAGQAAAHPPGRRPSGTTKPARPDDSSGKVAPGRATSTRDTERGNAADTNRSVKQAGSADPTGEGEADPSLPPEPPRWD